MKKELITVNQNGLYCEAGDFYIDPWRGVNRALITHGHSDHARYGSYKYLCSESSLHILENRLGRNARIQTVPYGKPVTINGVEVTYFPAGHVLGSAQILVSCKGERWVVSGDYNIHHNRSCDNFEPVKCDVFITESTFGLPIYNWKPEEEIAEEINGWWRNNALDSRASILYGYSLGKAQRILSLLDPSIGTIITHPLVESINNAYRLAGVELPLTIPLNEIKVKKAFEGAMIIAPPGAEGSSLEKRAGENETAFASGWMQVRGNRRRLNSDRGFVLSDHCDWKGLISAISDTGASKILVTHGFVSQFVRWLNENGFNAAPLETMFTGDAAGDDHQGGAEEVKE